MPNGLGAWGNVSVDAEQRWFTFSMIDASGDTWSEQLFVAINATYVAVQAWLFLYQLTTQASIYDVVESRGWFGEKDVSNAVAGTRDGVENGVNLLFKNPATRDTRPLRIVAPAPEIMLGSQDVPVLASDPLADLLAATLVLNAAYPFVHGQYTTRHERKNNSKVK